MFSPLIVLALGSILHEAFGAVIPLQILDERSFTCPNQVSGSQNITLPDPDPSVNATIQGLNEANLTFYNPIGSTNLTGLSTDDTIIDDISFKLKTRAPTADSVLGFFSKLIRRGFSSSSSSVRVSSSSSSSSFSSKSSGSGSRSSGSSKPVSGSSPSTTTKSPSGGSSTTKTVAAVNPAPKPVPPVKPPTAASPMSGTPAKTPTVVNNKSVYKTGVTPVNNVRPYYNSLPASNYRSSTSYSSYPTAYGSYYGQSYYGSRFAGQSTFGWYSYSYLNTWLWFYPAFVLLESSADNPGYGGYGENVAYRSNESSAIMIQPSSAPSNSSDGFTDLSKHPHSSYQRNTRLTAPRLP